MPEKLLSKEDQDCFRWITFLLTILFRMAKDDPQKFVDLIWQRNMFNKQDALHQHGRVVVDRDKVRFARAIATLCVSDEEIVAVGQVQMHDPEERTAVTERTAATKRTAATLFRCFITANGWHKHE